MADRGRAPNRLARLRLCLLAAVGLLACGAFWLTPLPWSGQALTPRLPWWVLAAVFAAVEVVVLHLDGARVLQPVTLNEVPLVLGLFLTDPRDMVLAVVIGPAAVHALYLRRDVLTVVVNGVLGVVAATVALSVFHPLAGSAPRADSTRAWLAALVAVVAARTLDCLLTTLVAVLHDGSAFRFAPPSEMVRRPAVSVVVACAGLIAMAALNADPHTGALLAVVGAAVVAGYRVHATLSDRTVELERLDTLTRAVAASVRPEEVLRSVLAGAREYLRAETAEIVLAGADGSYRRTSLHGSDGPDGPVTEQPVDPLTEEPWRTVLTSGRPVLLPRGTRTEPERTWLAGLGHRDVIVVPLRDESGSPGLLAVADRSVQGSSFDLEDVQSLQRAAEQAWRALQNGRLMDRLAYQAAHDTLTGLANRSTFHATLECALAAWARGEAVPFALLLIDAEGLVEVSATLGFQSADRLLQLLSRRLLDALPDPAHAARVGGSQFAVLMPHVAVPATALHMAGHLREVFAEPMTVEDVEIHVPVRMGIALAPGHGRDVGELMRAAASALQLARTSGTRIRVHEVADHPAGGGESQLAMLAELRRGLQRGELAIHVQPQARTDTGEVVGVEALARWTHPRLGLVGPAAFLPIAEHHGLIAEITAQVLDQAATAAAGWHREGRELSVAVNLSARSLTRDDVVRMVRNTLAAHALPPRLLTLEITEDSMIRDADAAIDLLGRLRALGVGISVDDYGTGYSSLSYLRRLPATEVKIDRSFISALAGSPGDLVIVRSIIDLAANLSLQVVAEGVEDRETWDQLARLRCDLVQGYYLARPFPVEALPEWLAGYRPRRVGAAPGRPRTTGFPVPAASPRRAG